MFSPGQKMKVGKRSCFLEETESFFDIWQTLERFSAELKLLQDYCDKNRVSLRVFGELFGPKINGRVDYGTEKKIAVFDIYQTVDNEETLLSQQFLVLI